MSFKTHDMSTVEGFITALKPDNKSWKNGDFVYRGQGDSGWSLKPSIFRENTNTTSWFGEKKTADEWVFAEWNILKTFIKECDTAGLAVPSRTSTFYLKHFNQNTNKFRYYDFPDPEIYELLALAQHYGIPTRLLDWTHRWIVAIYFAASDAVFHSGNLEDNNRLAVWVFNKDRINSCNMIKYSIEMVDAPSMTNNNLYSQQGCFTLLRDKSGAYARNQLYEVKNLENLFPTGTLTKITLPISKAKKILELCYKVYGISEATVFPSYYGAARGTITRCNIQVGRSINS